MKEGIFSFIWAGICALLSVWLVLYVDAKIGFSNDYFFQQLWMQSMIWMVSQKSIILCIVSCLLADRGT